MKPNAVITIFGTQQVVPDAPETIEMVTQGCYAYEPGHIVFSYEETEMTGQQGVVTTFTVDGDVVTLTRTGRLRSQMRFEVGKPYDSLYDAGITALLTRVCARHITVLLNERGGILDLEYALEIEHTDCGTLSYHIEVRKNPAP